MYPFGSGMPSAPPNNSSSSPYPQNIPFGAGFYAPPNQSPYASQSAHPNQHTYPQQATPYPPAASVPYPTASGAPYPTSGSAPYPTSGSAPYPTSGSTPYPPTGGSPYPSQSYPSTNNINTPYPAAFGSGHEVPRQFGSGYPPSVTQFNPYPPSSTSNMPYPPSRAPAATPYPSSHGSPYPVQQHGSFSTPNSNMASCFAEMRNSLQGAKTNSQAKGTPTVVPAANFDPVKDAHDLRKAMKGFGTDEDALINIICRRSNEQRQEIHRQYKTHFGKDLIEDVKSETSGNFEKLLIALLRPIVEFYVAELNAAMAGIGTDEDVLIEILCTLSNAEIHTIKNAYVRCYGAHLESELKSETSGNFKRLLVSLCNGNRDESGRTDVEAAQNDARELLKAGELRVGTDESTFNMILCQRNYQQLKLIFAEYEKMTGHTLEQAIKNEFSGDIMEGLIAIYRCVKNKAEYFASRLHKSMAGIGTNDSQLIRVIVSRCEIDMHDIKVAFERMYGKSLRSWIKGDTSGHYKHALYALIGEQRSS